MPRIDVVIPALDAAAGLAATLAGLRGLPVARVIVVDGGSRDGTAAVARRGGAELLAAPRGRGTQLAAGAAVATAPWLLFLHADTVLQPEAGAAVAAFLAGPGDRAGYFRLRLDDDAPQARRLEALVAWRCRVAALPYGDQGLLIPASLYRAVGGHPAIPLMEDVALVRRLGRARLQALDAAVVTSAARYRSGGYLARPLRNLGLLALYFAGVAPARLQRLYAPRQRR